MCSAEGISSWRTLGYTDTRSVVTSARMVPVRSARLKKRGAAVRLCFADIRASVMWLTTNDATLGQQFWTSR